VSDRADFGFFDLTFAALAPIEIVPPADVEQRVVVWTPDAGTGIQIGVSPRLAASKSAYTILQSGPETYLLAPHQALYAFNPKVAPAHISVYIAPAPEHDDPLESGSVWYDDDATAHP
jgi:hypothetical protein